MSHTWFSNEGDLVDHNRDKKNKIWSRFFNKPEGDSSTTPPPAPTRRNVEDLLMKLVQSIDRRDVKDFILLQILYQLSMIWYPSSSLGVPRHLFKYVECIEKANNTAWRTYIYSAMPQNIDEEVEQPNDEVKKIELPQQVIYWKSIAIMNQKLHRDNKNKFKDQIAADRVKISSLSVKVAMLFAQVRRLREELSEARSRSLTVYKNKRPVVEFEGEGPQSFFADTNKESEGPPIAEVRPLFFSDINKESEDAPTGEVPPTDTTDIDTEVEVPPTSTPCIDTFIEDEDAPLIIPMNKRKRDAKVAHAKVLTVAPLKKRESEER
ncbi:uncharacterized protein A4U43_C07F1170 [Asparagus officinalis]|uniref:Uncharacterized protein n=1 Tax=Asparagus officinalis TaxID=4686 RepID=A0A5P1E8D7_ASPOF|nr:uncharacterized protein A4U43_C07F1170 [Asparagus officinalis]